MLSPTLQMVMPSILIQAWLYNTICFIENCDRKLVDIPNPH